jgi:hypothetical protein
MLRAVVIFQVGVLFGAFWDLYTIHQRLNYVEMDQVTTDLRAEHQCWTKVAVVSMGGEVKFVCSPWIP